MTLKSRKILQNAAFWSKECVSVYKSSGNAGCVSVYNERVSATLAVNVLLLCPIGC